MLRIQFFLRFLTGVRPVRNLVRILPEAEDLFRSSLKMRKEGDVITLILRCPDQREQKKRLSDLVQKAQMYGVSLYQVYDRPSVQYCEKDSAAWKRAREAVTEVFSPKAVIPVISEEGRAWPGWQTVCFSPVNPAEMSSAAETEYYKRLIG
jgi:hypothetical protein